jgi:hypothetical protein
VGVHDHFIGKTEENNEKPESEQMERVWTRYLCSTSKSAAFCNHIICHIAFCVHET